MSQLTHPNTVAVFDYGRSPDGVFYYAMEYLGDGIDLENLVIDSRPAAGGRVVAILRAGVRRAQRSARRAASSIATSSRRTSSCASAAACPTSRRSSTSASSRRSPPTPAQSTQVDPRHAGVRRARSGHRSGARRPGRRSLRARLRRLLPAHRQAACSRARPRSTSASSTSRRRRRRRRRSPPSTSPPELEAIIMQLPREAARASASRERAEHAPRRSRGCRDEGLGSHAEARAWWREYRADHAGASRHGRALDADDHRGSRTRDVKFARENRVNGSDHWRQCATPKAWRRSCSSSSRSSSRWSRSTRSRGSTSAAARASRATRRRISTQKIVVDLTKRR